MQYQSVMEEFNMEVQSVIERQMADKTMPPFDEHKPIAFAKIVSSYGDAFA